MLQHRPCSRVIITHSTESLSNDALLFIAANLIAKEEANTSEVALSTVYKNISLIQGKSFSIFQYRNHTQVAIASLPPLKVVCPPCYHD
jgi:phosphohistidine swiveling domain-containing protein